MTGFLIVLMIIISILLIAVVLLQPGKGDMLSGGLGGLTGQFSTMFGTTKAAGLLQKITIAFAAAIIMLALVTNKFFIGGPEETQRPVTEGVTVPQTVPQQPQMQQQLPAPAPQQQQPQQQQPQQQQQQPQQQQGGGEK